MSTLQVLVQAISLRNQLLLPLSEPLLLDLDLFCETFSERLFLFLELWLVQLARSGLSEFTCLHLLRPVSLVVLLLGGCDEIKHVVANQDGAELLEIAVLLVLNLSNTPGVLTALDDAAVGGLDVLLGTDDGERHGGDECAGVGSGVLVVLLNWWLIDLDTLSFNDISDLKSDKKEKKKKNCQQVMNKKLSGAK